MSPARRMSGFLLLAAAAVLLISCIPTASASEVEEWDLFAGRELQSYKYNKYKYVKGYPTPEEPPVDDNSTDPEVPECDVSGYKVPRVSGCSKCYWECTMPEGEDPENSDVTPCPTLVCKRCSITARGRKMYGRKNCYKQAYYAYPVCPEDNGDGEEPVDPEARRARARRSRTAYSFNGCNAIEYGKYKPTYYKYKSWSYKG